MGMIGARQYASHRLEAPVRSRRVSGSAFKQHATGARLCRPAALKESRSLVTHAGESGVNVPDRWRVVKRFVTGAVSAKGRDRGASSAHGVARAERRRRSVDGVWGTEGSPHPWPVGGPLFCPAVHAAAPHNAAMNIRLFLGGLRPPKPSQGAGPGCAGLWPASAEVWGNPVSRPPSPRAYFHVRADSAWLRRGACPSRAVPEAVGRLRDPAPLRDENVDVCHS